MPPPLSPARMTRIYQAKNFVSHNEVMLRALIRAMSKARAETNLLGIGQLGWAGKNLSPRGTAASVGTAFTLGTNPSARQACTAVYFFLVLLLVLDGIALASVDRNLAASLILRYPCPSPSMTNSAGRDSYQRRRR